MARGAGEPSTVFVGGGGSEGNTQEGSHGAVLDSRM